MIERVTHEDIDRRLTKGGERFEAIEASLTEIRDLLKPLPQMQADIAATKEIVEAWGAVKTVGKFVKWFAGVIAAMTAIIVAAKVGATHLLR